MTDIVGLTTALSGRREFARHIDELILDDGPLDEPKYKTAREAYRLEPSPANRVRLNQARRR